MHTPQISSNTRRGTPSPRARRVMALLTCALTLLALGSGSTSAQATENNDGIGEGSVMQSFQVAARHWDVPLAVLMAVGWVESHWEQRNGDPSLDGGYGIMHIGGANGTMERAAKLTGLTPESIRYFEEANIEAGAALLSDISRKANTEGKNTTSIADWYAAVGAYSGALDPLVRDGYAQEVFRVIREGVSTTLSTGEVVSLPPTPVDSLPTPLPVPARDPDSDDYPPAAWVPAHPNNYTVGRPYPPLDKVLIHDTEGSYASAISWFQNPESRVAAHYVIRSSDGHMTQMVREANTGHHAGNWDYNVRSIGIEHEGYASQQGWYTEAMYQSSAALVRDVTEEYAIKKDRAHVIGHYQVPNQNHTDPGPFWNWTYYMSLVRRDWQRAALVDNTDPGFAPTPPQIDPQHYWWTHNGGYNGSNTYVTTSVVNQGSSYNSAAWNATLANSGYYDVYAFVPWVDNDTTDTSSAKYIVTASNGQYQATTSQRAITDVGSGSWAHLGKFHFNSGTPARVSLSDWTGESSRNVWFDAVMWIPALTSDPPPPPPTAPPTASPTRTRTPTRTHTRAASATRTATPTRTWTPVPTVPPQPTFTPGPCGMSFSDLPDTHWAYSYVSYLYCEGAVGGYADGTFRPENGSTRAQFTKMLVLGLGWQPYAPALPTFTDVPLGSTFYPYVEAAVQHGVIGGYPDGTFRPGNPLTRAQTAKILVLGRQWQLLTPQSPTFPDVLGDHWAYSYVETAFSHTIIGGFADGTFGPERAVNRAQLAKMVALAAQAP
jgi:N-acetylmuramoyl-L-alanine amidase/S-layer homology domain/Transglycosylase SLT domain